MKSSLSHHPQIRPLDYADKPDIHDAGKDIRSDAHMNLTRDPAQDLPLDRQVRECLTTLGISSLNDWDVLVFLHRHPASLGTADQIARLLGYPVGVVANVLDTLESLGLIRGSSALQMVRLYQVTSSHELEAGLRSRLGNLMSLSEGRAGRLLVAKQLRPRAFGQHAGAGLSARKQGA
jgi:DNA-binding MarR family transcriptional regulator